MAAMDSCFALVGAVRMRKVLAIARSCAVWPLLPDGLSLIQPFAVSQFLGENRILNQILLFEPFFGQLARE